MDDEDERRYGEQVRTLEEWDALDEERVAAYVTTAKSHLLAEAAVIRLIAHLDMTEDLLDLVETELHKDWTAAHARLSERRVRLPLEDGLLDESHQLAAVDQGSRNVHLWLLEYVDLSREALERLAANGSTRAVRNRAAQRLRSRRFSNE